MDLTLTFQSSREARLVEEARAGSNSAFAELVEPVLPTALAVARAIAGSSDDGADAVQDALLSAWLGLRALRDPAAFRAWFRRHVVRAAMRRAKTLRRVGRIDPRAM